MYLTEKTYNFIIYIYISIITYTNIQYIYRHIIKWDEVWFISKVFYALNFHHDWLFPWYKTSHTVLRDFGHAAHLYCEVKLQCCWRKTLRHKSESLCQESQEQHPLFSNQSMLPWGLLTLIATSDALFCKLKRLTRQVTVKGSHLPKGFEL